jgi:hypothetical protein
MANEILYVSGKAKHCRAVVPDRFQDEEFWKVVLYPDEKSLDTLRRLQARGIKNTMRLDDDGFHMQFKRPLEKPKKNGGKIKFEAPKVFDKDGKPMDGKLVGNGSDVTLKLDIYGNPQGPRKYLAARWESMRVDNLVEYNPDSDYTPEEAQAADGLMDQKIPF